MFYYEKMGEKCFFFSKSSNSIHNLALNDNFVDINTFFKY